MLYRLAIFSINSKVVSSSKKMAWYTEEAETGASIGQALLFTELVYPTPPCPAQESSHLLLGVLMPRRSMGRGCSEHVPGPSPVCGPGHPLPVPTWPLSHVWTWPLSLCPPGPSPVCGTWHLALCFFAGRRGREQGPPGLHQKYGGRTEGSEASTRVQVFGSGSATYNAVTLGQSPVPLSPQ